MNSVNKSKITLVIFIAINAINTQLFASENSSNNNRWAHAYEDQRAYDRRAYNQNELKNDNIFRIAKIMLAFSVIIGSVSALKSDWVYNNLFLKNEEKIDHESLCKKLPEAYNRVEMCRRTGCSSRVEADAKKIVKECDKIDHEKTFGIFLTLSQHSYASMLKRIASQEAKDFEKNLLPHDDNQNIRWSLLPEAFRRVEMCKIASCSSQVQTNTKKFIEECDDIDPEKTSDTYWALSQNYFAFRPKEEKAICLITDKKVIDFEKNFDEQSLEKMITVQTSKK